VIVSKGKGRKRAEERKKETKASRWKGLKEGGGG